MWFIEVACWATQTSWRKCWGTNCIFWNSSGSRQMTSSDWSEVSPTASSPFSEAVAGEEVRSSPAVRAVTYITANTGGTTGTQIYPCSLFLIQWIVLCAKGSSFSRSDWAHEREPSPSLPCSRMVSVHLEAQIHANTQISCVPIN